MSTDHRITVDHVTKRFDDRTVVDDLTFVVEPGRVTGFLGPNGSGKSTTMKILLDLAAADGGAASIGGVRYRDLADPAGTVGVALEPNAFHPPPKVRSAVVRFDVFEDGPRVGSVSPEHFDRVVRGAFSQRRKTLVNSLGSLFDKARVREALEERGLDVRSRAEALSIDDFRALAAALADSDGGS